MLTRTQIGRCKRAGSSLLLVVMAIIVLAMLGLAMMRVGLSSRILAIRDCQALEARCAADAGLTKALYEMNQRLRNNTWSDDSMPTSTLETLPGAEAVFDYAVSGCDANGYAIASVGHRNQSRKTVSATVRVKSIFDHAILVRDRLSLMPNTLVSGYNSDDPTDTDIDVKIGTISVADERITLGPGTVVEGDAFVGVDGNPATGIGAGGTINGRKFAMTEEFEFPVITVPPLPDMNTGLAANGATLTISPADNGTYTDITLSQHSGADGVLEIAGGDVLLHITGDIDMSTGAEIIVRPGSSLTLYVDGSIYANNSDGFNNEAGYVEDFELYATGTSEQVFNLKAKSSLFGAIYAPDVNIELYPGIEIHGAIVANNVTFKSGCNYYYDEALRNASVEDEGARFEIKRWSGD